MKNPLRNLPFFSLQAQRGILLLCLLILAVVLVGPRLGRRSGLADGLTSEQQEAYSDFCTGLRETDVPSPPPADLRDDRRPDTYPRTPTLHPFPFDPNRADSATLRRLGLPGWMARNIVRYREKGGRFRQVEDFRRVYGLTDEQYEALRPQLRIDPADTLRPQAPQLWATDEGRHAQRPRKYPAGTVVDLNRADTSELQRIPGIGSKLARRIADYRQRLGGFCRVEQLKEIYLDCEQLRPWLRVDSTAIRRLNLNRADVEALARHPYLNYRQAKAIVGWRQAHGLLTGLHALRLYDEFSDSDLRRLTPYVCFD